MHSHLHNADRIEHNDPVCAADGGEAVGDDASSMSLISLDKAGWIRASDSLSRAQVASSKMKMRESRIKAMARRCFCPPESLAPRSPIYIPTLSSRA